MKLTEEQTKKILDRLNEYKDSRRPCSMCGNNNWQLSDVVFELREFHEGNMVIGANSSIMPVLAISCNRCGNTHFINAIKMDIIKPSVDDGKSK